MFLILSMLLTFNSYADEWMCHEVATSKLTEFQYFSCGVGEGDSEAKAREDALINAKREFDLICNQDFTCKKKAKKVEPKRSSCEELNGAWKCYRGVVYYLSRNNVEHKTTEELDLELEEVKRKYEEEKIKNNKKKQIEEYKAKLKNKDFEDEKNTTRSTKEKSVEMKSTKKKSSENNSGFNHFVILGGGIGVFDYSTTELSYLDISTNFFIRYIPKGNFGFQVKTSFMSVEGDEIDVTDENISDDITPEMLSGDIDTLTYSILYYFSALRKNNSGNFYIGLGAGSAQATMDYTYRDDSFSKSQRQIDVDTSVTCITLGYTYSSLKKSSFGVDFALDYYGSSDFDFDSLVDINLNLIWSF